MLIRGSGDERQKEIKTSQEICKEEDTYGQGWIKGNQVALENANTNRQNHVIGFVNATILRYHGNATSRVLQFPDNLQKDSLRYSIKKAEVTIMEITTKLLISHDVLKVLNKSQKKRTPKQ